MHRSAVAVLVLACTGPVLASPEGPAEERAPARLITWNDVVALSRERAPLVVAARARIEEARGRLTGASVFLRENPSLTAGAAARVHEDGVVPDAKVELSQAFEIPGRRSARMEAASASVEQLEAEAMDVERSALRDAASAFLKALHARDRTRVTDENVSDLDAMVALTERRFAAGEVSILDVNFARGATARARASRRIARALEAAALGELRAVLGLPVDETLAVEGVLLDGVVTQPLDGQALLRLVDERADLRALRAAIATAEAEGRLADLQAWPDVGLGASYTLDDGDNVWGGNITVGIPIFNRAQGPRAEARARAEALRRSHDAIRSSAAARLAASMEVLAQRIAAVEEIRANALPVFEENARLVHQSYAAGEAGLAEVVEVERAAVETRLEHLDFALDAALARVELDFITGPVR